jgi:hypothetical protein
VLYPLPYLIPSPSDGTTVREEEVRAVVNTVKSEGGAVNFHFSDDVLTLYHHADITLSQTQAWKDATGFQSHSDAECLSAEQLRELME